MAQIVSGLASGSECRSSLQRLSVNGLHVDWGSLQDVGFSSLRGLRVLSLADTDLTDEVLDDICALPRLESLDISCSAVSNLSALRQCKTTLKSLVAHRLKQLHMSPASLLSLLRQLKALRHLDFSDDHLSGGDGGDGDELVRLLLEGRPPELLPSLVSLDVSGRRKMSEAAVAAFVDVRGGLVFLGLAATGMSSCDVLPSRTNLKASTPTAPMTFIF